MATYIAMMLNVDGVETPVWQKCAIASEVVVTAQTVTYVDANDQPIAMPDQYEMTVVDGQTLSAPGA